MRLRKPLQFMIGLLGAVALYAGMPAESMGAPIYTVNRNFQSGASISGTITTDGMLGSIGNGNISSWSLTLKDGEAGTTGPLTEVNSTLSIAILAGPSPVVATPDGAFLTFDFSNVGGGGFFGNTLSLLDTATFQEFWCLEGINDGCTTAPGEFSETLTMGGNLVGSKSSLSGPQIIGVAAPVPEPSTLLLFGSGIALIIGWKWRLDRQSKRRIALVH